MAIQAAFSNLSPNLKPGIPILGFLSEAEPSFLASSLIAADASNLNLESIALRPGSFLEQILWRPLSNKPDTAEATETDIDNFSRTALQSHLAARAEPAPYPVVHAVVVAALARQHALKPAAGQPPPIVLSRLQAALQRTLSDPSLLTHFGSSQHSPEIGLWWLQPSNTPGQSMADRSEIEVVRFLQHHPDCSREEIDEGVCEALPGLMTPPFDLVEACLESYGEEYPPESNHWKLLAGEAPAERRSELKAIHHLLQGLGHQLSYRTSGEGPLVWVDESGQVTFNFFVIASAIINRFVFDEKINPRRGFIVIPGSRANLLSFKLKRDPLLNQAVSAGWRFLKFRHIRLLASSLLLSRDTWEDQVNADPIEYKPTQIEMF